MSDNKNNKNPASLRLDALPNDVLHHVGSMLLSAEMANLYVTNKKVANEIKPDYLRELIGLNRPEHQDIKVNDAEIISIYQLLNKITQLNTDTKFDLRWESGDYFLQWGRETHPHLFNLLKLRRIPNTIKYVCKKHPELAKICMTVPFLRERLPEQEHIQRHPSFGPRVLGAVLGFLVGVIGKTLNAVAKLLRILWFIIVNPLLFLSLILATPLGYALLGQLSEAAAVVGLLVGIASLGYAVFTFVDDEKRNNRLSFVKSLKASGMLILGFITTLVMLPINIFRPVLRGYAAGHEQVLESVTKFVYWDEEQAALDQVVNLKNSDPLPSFSSIVFPKAWSHKEYMNEIFNPTIAELAALQESNDVPVIDDIQQPRVVGMSTHEMSRALPEVVYDSSPKDSKSRLSLFKKSSREKKEGAVNLPEGRTPLLLELQSLQS
jgi:hypothetical protein